MRFWKVVNFSSVPRKAQNEEIDSQEFRFADQNLKNKQPSENLKSQQGEQNTSSKKQPLQDENQQQNVNSDGGKV